MTLPRSRTGRMRAAAARIAWPVAAKPVATGSGAAERAADADEVMGNVRGEQDGSKPADALSRSARLAPFRLASHSGAGVSRRTLRLKWSSPVVLPSGIYWSFHEIGRASCRERVWP